MPSAVGQKGAVKRSAAFLGEAVHGATQMESQGGVTKSMTSMSGAGLGLAGRLLGAGAQKKGRHGF